MFMKIVLSDVTTISSSVPINCNSYAHKKDLKLWIHKLKARNLDVDVGYYSLFHSCFCLVYSDILDKRAAGELIPFTGRCSLQTDNTKDFYFILFYFSIQTLL